MEEKKTPENKQTKQAKKKGGGGENTRKKKLIWELWCDVENVMQECEMFLVLDYVLACRIVEISCSMKAQGVVLPTTRHFMPLGQ